jgi:hypothetical protein
MVQARRQEAWQHTAWLAAMIANANRDPKRRPQPFMPDEFNPMVKRHRRAGAIKVNEETIGDLRQMFTASFSKDGQKVSAL